MSKAKIARLRKPKFGIVKCQDKAYWFFSMQRSSEINLEIKGLEMVGDRALFRRLKPLRAKKKIVRNCQRCGHDQTIGQYPRLMTSEAVNRGSRYLGEPSIMMGMQVESLGSYMELRNDAR